ncbi:hypothetical protein GCM10027088_08320 [Nocardia goodfellowii]
MGATWNRLCPERRLNPVPGRELRHQQCLEKTIDGADGAANEAMDCAEDAADELGNHRGPP